MSKKDETTEGKQFAEFLAVKVVGQRNKTDDPSEPILWIRERKQLKKGSSTGTEKELIMWFLFWIENSPRLMTNVEVRMVFENGNWHLVSVKLQSEYQPGLASTEKWVGGTNNSLIAVGP